MPYDPRMLQMAQMGVGMMGPQQGKAFADARNQPPRPKQWWEQPMPQGQASQMGGQDDPAKPGAKQPPSLLQMLMSSGYGKMPLGGAGATGTAPQASSLGPIPGMGLMNSPWFFT